mgnify:CR=1 FL=1
MLTSFIIVAIRYFHRSILKFWDAFVNIAGSNMQATILVNIILPPLQRADLFNVLVTQYHE